MNCHVPQSYATRYELQSLTLVPTQIISPASCKPIISIVQDTLVGAYLMTWNDKKISQKSFNNMMMYNQHFNMQKFPLRKEKTFTGHQAYSTILPELSYGDMIINGDFQKGVLNKKILGSSAGGLIQIIYNMYGDLEAQRFLDSTQDIVTRWLENHSFSIGYGDCMVPKELQNEIDQIIETNLEEANALMKKAQLGIYNEKIDEDLLANSMENEMTDKLQSIAMRIDEVLKKKIDPKNRLKIAVESGAKGKDLNIRQIVGNVGQQIVWNTRITDGFTERTLPHFFKTDYGPMAKGFIKNSYFKGLSPTEFFFHMMAGRTGNIDTAIKTAGTGYISRKLMKTMEDLKMEYDSTVRNANGNIVQFMYGEDSFDPIKLEVNLLNIIQYSDKEMEQKYQFEDINNAKYWKNIILPKAVDKMMKDNKYQDKLEKEFQRLMEYRNNLRYRYLKYLDVITNNRCYLPVNFYRLLPVVKNKFNITESNIPDIDPIYIIDEVEKLIEKCRRYITQEIGLPFLEIMIRSYLASKQILTFYRFNKIAFDFLVLTIHNKVLSSFAQYGEMVGPIAAQSIGEPSTQLTLNTFHSAGTKANVTEGVPRLTEIISVSKEIKRPIMNIYLKEEYSESMEKANSLASHLEYTKIGDIVRESNILYDAHTLSSLDEDVEFIKTYYEFNELFDLDMKDIENLSNWVLRIIFDKEQLMNKDITMAEIQNAVLNNIASEDDIQCIFSDDNSGNLVMRIRIRNDLENENYIYFLDEFENSIRNITLRGIPKVVKVFPQEANLVKYNPDSTCSNQKIWKLQSQGSNLLDIMKSDFIDTTRTDCNHITEILDVLGLEAARNSIINEITEVFAQSNINYRHIFLLADVMTFRGGIMQVNRFGVNRSAEYGPIAKASFEEVTDVIMNSAIFSAKDNMKGASANITMGQFVKAGTNAFGLFLDEEKLAAQPATTPVDEEEPGVTMDQVDQDIEKMYQGYDPELMIDDDDFHFGYNLEDTDEYDLGGAPLPPLSPEAIEAAEIKPTTRKIKVITEEPPTEDEDEQPPTEGEDEQPPTEGEGEDEDEQPPTEDEDEGEDKQPIEEVELDADETPKPVKTTKTIKIKKKKK